MYMLVMVVIREMVMAIMIMIFIMVHLTTGEKLVAAIKQQKMKENDDNGNDNNDNGKDSNNII